MAGQYVPLLSSPPTILATAITNHDHDITSPQVSIFIPTSTSVHISITITKNTHFHLADKDALTGVYRAPAAEL